jgi:hypothetical protein
MLKRLEAFINKPVDVQRRNLLKQGVSMAALTALPLGVLTGCSSQEKETTVDISQIRKHGGEQNVVVNRDLNGVVHSGERGLCWIKDGEQANFVVRHKDISFIPTRQAGVDLNDLVSPPQNKEIVSQRKNGGLCVVEPDNGIRFRTLPLILSHVVCWEQENV